MLIIPFLLLMPIAEIATFVWVGARIGVGMTLLLVVVSAVIGIWLVRTQGFATAARVQTMIARGESPALGMLEGLALLAAGILLIIPGFLTDIVAFVLLTPPLRRALIRYYLRRTPGQGHVNPDQPSTKPSNNAGRIPLEGKSRRVD